MIYRVTIRSAALQSGVFAKESLELTQWKAQRMFGAVSQLDAVVGRCLGVPPVKIFSAFKRVFILVSPLLSPTKLHERIASDESLLQSLVWRLSFSNRGAHGGSRNLVFLKLIGGSSVVHLTCAFCQRHISLGHRFSFVGTVKTFSNL